MKTTKGNSPRLALEQNYVTLTPRESLSVSSPKSHQPIHKLLYLLYPGGGVLVSVKIKRNYQTFIAVKAIIDRIFVNQCRN